MAVVESVSSGGIIFIYNSGIQTQFHRASFEYEKFLKVERA